MFKNIGEWRLWGFRGQGNIQAGSSESQVVGEGVIYVVGRLPTLAPSHSAVKPSWKLGAPFWGLFSTRWRGRWARGVQEVWCCLLQSAEAIPRGGPLQCGRETEDQTSSGQGAGIWDQRDFYTLLKGSNITVHAKLSLPEENWHSVYYLPGNVLLLLPSSSRGCLCTSWVDWSSLFPRGYRLPRPRSPQSTCSYTASLANMCLLSKCD